MRGFSQGFKNTGQLIPLSRGTFGKILENGCIRDIVVREIHRPLALNSSWIRLKSSGRAFFPAFIAVMRASSSAKYAGSSA